MTNAPPIEAHHKWGRMIIQYPKLYTQQALFAQVEAPVDDTKRAIGRRIALDAIQKICQLANPNLNEYSQNSLIGCITLEKLECILETARFAGELQNFTLPNL
ncbi:hypothetical protein FRC11_006722, partial [Ceratobasidium sp. 423]